jgi:hypothetical protein
LVVGSLAPDLAYLVGMPARLSHSWTWFAPSALAVGALFAAWWLMLVAPALRESVGHGPVVDWSILVANDQPSRVGVAALSLVVGAATHVLWDGFTHAGEWPARLYTDVVTAARLWHYSSLLGALALTWILHRSIPARRPYAWRPSLVLALGLCVVLLVLGVAGSWPAAARWNASIRAAQLGAAAATLLLAGRRAWSRVQNKTAGPT